MVGGGGGVGVKGKSHCRVPLRRAWLEFHQTPQESSLGQGDN